MKKLKSSCTNMAIVLTLIAVLAGGALALVNNMTKDRIAEIKIENEKKAVSEVLGGGDVNITDTIVAPAKEGGKDSVYVYVTEKGYAVKTVDPDNASFGGGLTLMVGFDMNLNVLGYSVLETQETPGLGAKAAEWFKNESNEKANIIGRTPGEKGFVVSKDGGDVDAITASTITSRAFLRAVNAAYNACSAEIKNEN